MPNGAVMGWCNRCEQWRLVHGRNYEDYAYFIGSFCDPCYDWIEAQVLMWNYREALQTIDHHLRHPLSQLLNDDGTGHLISEFVGGSMVPYNHEEE